jgi:hypothetical protein
MTASGSSGQALQTYSGEAECIEIHRKSIGNDRFRIFRPVTADPLWRGRTWGRHGNALGCHGDAMRAHWGAQGTPKGPQSDPKDLPGDPKVTPRTPKVAQKRSQGAPGVAKGAQRDPRRDENKKTHELEGRR